MPKISNTTQSSNSKMETYFIDLHVHTLYSQEKCANLSVQDTLNYYQKLGARQDKRIYIRINDHDTMFGGVDAMEEFLTHREKYPNLFVIPGMECNTSLNYVLKYPKPNYKPSPYYPDSNDKYKFVFKQAHIGVAPCLKDLNSYKKWKNSKDLQVYSILSKLHVDLNDNNGVYRKKDQIANFNEEEKSSLTNLGHQILALKNLVRNKYNVIIPFSAYYDCLKEGMNYKEIVESCFDVTCEYLQKHYQYFNFYDLDRVKKHVKTMLAIEIRSNGYKNLNVSQIVQQLEDLPNFFKNKNGNIHFATGGLKRINFDELCKMVYDVGGFIDIEHPNVRFSVHTNSTLPKEYFEDVDLSVLSKADQEKVRNSLNSSNLVNLTDTFGSETFGIDQTGMIKLQLFKKVLDLNGIKLTNGIIDAEVPKNLIQNRYKLEKILKIMESNKIIPSIGYDNHMNTIDKAMLLAKDRKLVKNKNGKIYEMNDATVKEMYGKLKDKLELHEFKTYKIFSDKLKKVDNFEPHKQNKPYLAHMDRVTKDAFCDVILGREVNFKDSTMFELKAGAIAKDDELNNITVVNTNAKSKFDHLTNNIHKILNYSNFDELKQDEKDFVKSLIDEYTLQYKNLVETDDSWMYTKDAELITKIYNKLDEHFEKDCLCK